MRILMNAHTDTKNTNANTNARTHRETHTHTCTQEARAAKLEASRFAEVAPLLFYNHYLSVCAPLVNNMLWWWMLAAVCARASWLFVCPVLFLMSWTLFWKLLELLRPSASSPPTGSMACRGLVLPRSKRAFFCFVFLFFSRPKYCLGKEVHMCEYSTALDCFWWNYILRKENYFRNIKTLEGFSLPLFHR